LFTIVALGLALLPDSVVAQQRALNSHARRHA